LRRSQICGNGIVTRLVYFFIEKSLKSLNFGIVPLRVTECCIALLAVDEKVTQRFQWGLGKYFTVLRAISLNSGKRNDIMRVEV
jgi:hypothetical protein